MNLRVPHSIRELRELLAIARGEGRSIGLVPTMGALHAGHAELIKRARQDAGYVAVSIFVNPIQFNQPEDYDRYPRDFARDQEFCEARGVDCIFAPPAAEMYARPLRTAVDVGVVSQHLCGAFRPGHFRGVATVVAKLLNIVQPDFAYFGEKDAQQLAVIRRMVEDLNLPVEIRGVPTVREADGLAVSSRNELLDAAQRRVAPVLYQTLQAAEQAIIAGERDADAVKGKAKALFAEHAEVRPEYFEIVEPDEMQPITKIEGPVRVACALWIGSTRLIDNILVMLPEK